MCKVKCIVLPGIIPSEKIVEIETFGGQKVEVAVSSTTVEGSTLRAHRIGEHDGQVLIELPRETSSGDWRVWVSEAQIVGRG